MAFARSIGITDTGEAGLKALRALPAEKISGDMSMGVLLTGLPTYAGGPINDGEVVSATPERKILQGSFAKVPLFIGTTGDDLAITFPRERTRPLDFFGPDAERARLLYDSQGTLPEDKLASLIAKDMTMQEPARFVARRMTAAGMPAWLYRFDYVADSLRPQATSAGHASELAYLFDQMDAGYGNATTGRDRAMARTFHRSFANFVKTGDPNGAGLTG